MKILEGRSVSENISKTFEERINRLKIKPHLAVLGIEGSNESNVYINTIRKNCGKYNINFTLLQAKNEEEFIFNFEKIKNNKEITGIMIQTPIPKHLEDFINTIPSEKDVECIGIENMGKLFTGKKDPLVPCTSMAVIKTLDFYGIDLEGKKVAVVGRSNIVGKPLIPLLLQKNATVTVCHSKTKNLSEETKAADVVIMAIGKAKFLKKEDIKEGAILIDVGINFEDGKIVGDIDFESVKEKANACTPVPGGIGTVTNTLLLDNVIKSIELKMRQ